MLGALVFWYLYVLFVYCSCLFLCLALNVCMFGSCMFVCLAHVSLNVRFMYVRLVYVCMFGSCMFVCLARVCLNVWLVYVGLVDQLLRLKHLFLVFFSLLMVEYHETEHPIQYRKSKIYNFTFNAEKIIIFQNFYIEMFLQILKN